MKQANILVDNEGTARVSDFGLMTMADLSMIILSESAVSSCGTLCWMSPELLDPPRFGSNGRPTRESDCYALGMVIYEVSSIRSSRTSLIHPATGSYWPSAVPSRIRLHTRARCAERRASRETSRRRISGFFRHTLAVGAVVLERVEFRSTDRPATARLPFSRRSYLGSSFGVPRHCE